MADAKEKLEGVNARLMNLFKAEKQTMMAFNGLTVAATRAASLSSCRESSRRTGIC